MSLQVRIELSLGRRCQHFLGWSNTHPHRRTPSRCDEGRSGEELGSLSGFGIVLAAGTAILLATVVAYGGWRFLRRVGVCVDALADGRGVGGG